MKMRFHILTFAILMFVIAIVKGCHPSGNTAIAITCKHKCVNERNPNKCLIRCRGNDG